MKLVPVIVPVVLCGLLFAACSGNDSSDSDKHPVTAPTLSPTQIAANREALKEVAITSCAPNGAHHVVIKGTAHNATSGGATYTVQLAIRDKSGTGRYATAAAANDVAPAATAHWSAVTTARFESGMTCKVTSVSRSATP